MKLRALIIIGCLAFARVTSAQSTTPLPIVFELVLDGKRVDGMPLAWSKDKVFLLGRDGALSSFNPNGVTTFRKTALPFTPLPTTWMKSALEQELGPKYEVTAAGDFLVAHPRGAGHWAERFDELSRSFTSYFRVRGFDPQKPTFPLVAIVYRTREEFERAIIANGMTPGEGLIGAYLHVGNRTVLYDLDEGRRGRNQAETIATIIHEAAHQIAFNTGIHSRWAPPPRWVAEGLGTMFEPRGVWNAQTFPNREDRINRERLNRFREYRTTRRGPDAIVKLLRDERTFDANVLDAYAEAWALTFYLVETYPREYARYLKKTVDRPAFTEYDPKQRLTDFVEVFGSDFRLFDARYLRFIDELK